MSDNKIVVTKEQIQKAMACETAEELMALAKAEGIELTKEEAESYLAELEDFELDGDMLKRVAGGRGYADLCWSNTKPILTQWMNAIRERAPAATTGKKFLPQNFSARRRGANIEQKNLLENES